MKLTFFKHPIKHFKQGGRMSSRYIIRIPENEAGIKNIFNEHYFKKNSELQLINISCFISNNLLIKLLYNFSNTNFITCTECHHWK